MIDVQQPNQNTEYPNVAEVYFTDGGTLGPAIILLEVGECELAELIVSAMEQMAEQKFSPTFGNIAAAFVFQAVATGNRVSLHPAPMVANFPMQVSSLYQKERAIGGVGTVLVDVGQELVTTYGGRGFNEVAPSNPYQPCQFALELLEDMPDSGQEAPPDVDVKAPAKKKAARKKKAGRKKAARSGTVRI